MKEKFLYFLHMDSGQTFLPEVKYLNIFGELGSQVQELYAPLEHTLCWVQKQAGNELGNFPNITRNTKLFIKKRKSTLNCWQSSSTPGLLLTTTTSNSSLHTSCIRQFRVHFTLPVEQIIGPSGVRALPLAAGINVVGHYKWHFFLLFLSSGSLLILP